MSGARDDIVWHDAECGAYDGDLEAWERICGERSGPILELGAGTGRLALHLARRGHEVVAVEMAPHLADELRARGAGEKLPLEVVTADARTIALERRFPLVIAAMQFVQLFLSPEERRAALEAWSGHLAPGGTLAAAIVDGTPDILLPSDAPEVLPDIREAEGFVYVSQPLGSTTADGVISSERRRQRVSPAGEMATETHVDRLAVLDVGAFEADARGAGLDVVSSETVAPTDLHVGSRIVLLEPAG